MYYKYKPCYGNKRKYCSKCCLYNKNISKLKKKIPLLKKKLIKNLSKKTFVELYQKASSLVLNYEACCWENSTCTSVIPQHGNISIFLLKLFKLHPFTVIAGGYPAFLKGYKKTYNDIDVYLFVENEINGVEEIIRTIRKESSLCGYRYLQTHVAKYVKFSGFRILDIIDVVFGKPSSPTDYFHYCKKCPCDLTCPYLFARSCNDGRIQIIFCSILSVPTFLKTHNSYLGKLTYFTLKLLDTFPLDHVKIALSCPTFCSFKSCLMLDITGGFNSANFLHATSILKYTKPQIYPFDNLYTHWLKKSVKSITRNHIQKTHKPLSLKFICLHVLHKYKLIEPSKILLISNTLIFQ
jgi:hypothetical protein